jgi:hypothetical protein
MALVDQRQNPVGGQMLAATEQHVGNFQPLMRRCNTVLAQQGDQLMATVRHCFH